ncbi:MAG: histone H1 [Bacteroidetes bacterium]|nr:histone H1 [Bacteroidota bacterium]MCH7965644.1 histone H1 [Bacteroidota bacterium]MCH8034684.1 histone H1 [Bacteroidota bacterium]
MDKFQQLVDYVQTLETDFHKFYEKGQAAAGTRVRKGLSELRKMCQDVRKNVQEVKAERKAAKSG